MDTLQFWEMATPKVAKVLQLLTGKTRIPGEWHEQGQRAALAQEKDNLGPGGDTTKPFVLCG